MFFFCFAWFFVFRSIVTALASRHAENLAFAVILRLNSSSMGNMKENIMELKMLVRGIHLYKLIYEVIVLIKGQPQNYSVYSKLTAPKKRHLQFSWNYPSKDFLKCFKFLNLIVFPKILLLV